MNKIFLALVLFFALSDGAYAGPFGLHMGMEEKDFKGTLIPAEKVPFVYKAEVPKPHSAFSYYLVLVAPKTGLCKVFAMGKEINTSVYGEDIQDDFEKMREQLSKKYGEGEIYDFLKKGSIWKEKNEWMTSLIRKERVLSAYWGKEKIATLPDDLKGIALKATAKNGDTGSLILTYEFENVSGCFEEKNSLDSDSL